MLQLKRKSHCTFQISLCSALLTHFVGYSMNHHLSFTVAHTTTLQPIVSMAQRHSAHLFPTFSELHRPCTLLTHHTKSLFKSLRIQELGPYSNPVTYTILSQHC